MALNRVTTLRARTSLAFVNLIARVTRGFARPGTDSANGTGTVARILVIELWNIGDVILVMPFLAQLRRRFPDAKVTILARSFARELLAGTGLVDEFIAADLNWTPGDQHSLPRRIGDLWRVSGELRRTKFDLAFSSRLHLREHLLLALSGARRRVGFSFGADGAALTDAVVVRDAHRHKVEDWVQLLEPFGGVNTVDAPRLRVTDSERLWANGYLASRGIPKEDLVVGIHPGASVVEKRWPLDRFREVTAAMAGRPGVRVVTFVDPSGYGAELSSVAGTVQARVGLRELIALISLCDLLVCNDSGPMHIAGALGVPTVAMFGAEIDQWFSPLGEGHEILTPDDRSLVADSSAEGVRAPTGIRSSQVLDAVGRAVQRLRSRGTFSRI